MSCGWTPWGLFFLLPQAATLLAVPPSAGLPTGPKPFSLSHYDLLQEYSPFVKSMEAAKETKKSPDLVVVGYGRIGGENHVIVQLKDNSEKREKIGSRYGSKDFPYRLLSVTNASDRKKFVAVLEDRNRRELKIFYASESTSLGSGLNSTASPSSQTASDQLTVVQSKRPPYIPPEVQNAGASVQTPSADPIEKLKKEIQIGEEKVRDPEFKGDRTAINELLNEKKQQLQSFQNPRDFESASPASQPVP